MFFVQFIKSLRIKTCCCCFLLKERVHLQGGSRIAPAHIYSSPESGSSQDAFTLIL